MAFFALEAASAIAGFAPRIYPQNFHEFLTMNHIDNLVTDIRTVAQHVASNHNYDYGPTIAPQTAVRVLTTCDVDALDRLIGWVFAVSRTNLKRGTLNGVEQAAYGAALRLDDALQTIHHHHEAIRRRLVA